VCLADRIVHHCQPALKLKTNNVRSPDRRFGGIDIRLAQPEIRARADHDHVASVLVDENHADAGMIVVIDPDRFGADPVPPVKRERALTVVVHPDSSHKLCGSSESARRDSLVRSFSAIPFPGRVANHGFTDDGQTRRFVKEPDVITADNSNKVSAHNFDLLVPLFPTHGSACRATGRSATR
jgi:hypothetical protein